MMTRSNAEAVCNNLRARDRAEIACYGYTPAMAVEAFLVPAVLARAFNDAQGPQALIAFHALTPATLAVSLMATERWPAVARRVFRWGHARARPFLLDRGFLRAECRTMEGHDDAIRFLERLGFVRECHVPVFGATGATFIQYAWRLNDHVPLQIAQDAAAATTTTAS